MTADQQRIGRTTADSVEAWPQRDPSAPEGAPNVVMILLDDVGFAHYSSFGSSIETPNIDRLAAEGLRYRDFHTTAVCSPTRASLLTGRNCHSVGFGHVTERVAGYPGYSMRLPDSASTIADTLRSNGYSTWAIGKWHLTPSYETGPQGPFDRWPLGRGFQRFYGFLAGSTDQFAPELYRDNTPVEPPATAADGYHLSADLVDESIRRIGELRSAAPKQPFFLYLTPGACHAPHQAPAEWIERYRGAFDHGWDVERERVLERQKELSVVPPDTVLGTNNPGVVAWDSLAPEEQALYSRMMEAYAGFLSYTDAQLGRLFDYLDETGQLDDTLILLCSDNGASGEGGPEGSVDEGLYINDQPQRAADALLHLDDIGGPKLYNHYPWGWAQAGNTPFRWYKQFTHAGGITNGLLVRWPGGGVPAGEVRDQYHHVIDITPTILDAVGLEAPAAVRGVTQQPMHGVSMRYSFQDGDAATRRPSQHYEMWGNRGFWRDGWMAVCRLQPDAPGAYPPAPMTIPFEELQWELYDHRTDPSECVDLAGDHPELLRSLVDEWWAAAGRYDVLPVDIRPRSRRWPENPPLPAGSEPGASVFFGAVGPFERGVSPKLAGGSFRMTAVVTVPDEGARGVLYSLGGMHGGYCWHLRDGRLQFEAAQSSVHTETVSVPVSLAAGRHELSATVIAGEDLTGTVAFAVDGVPVGGGTVARLLKRMPIGSARTTVGYTASPTVSGAVPAPSHFTGTLHSVQVTTGDQIDLPLGPELQAELREQ